MNTAPKYERSNDYRKQFFYKNKPTVRGNYICAYCGRWLKADKTTVDHLIPIGKVRSGRGICKAIETGIFRMLLKLFKISDVNDPKNLVAACKRCNSKKGAKTGFWIIRGLLGRHSSYWILHWLVVAAFWAVIVTFILGEVIK